MFGKLICSFADVRLFPPLPDDAPMAAVRNVANFSEEKNPHCRIGKVRMKQPAPMLRPASDPRTLYDLVKQRYPAWGMKPIATTVRDQPTSVKPWETLWC